MELAQSNQLVGLAGNHDYMLQGIDEIEPHLSPHDILLIGEERPHIFMHGHQFDEATNPVVAPFYGEVVSECLGVFYQGPDRYWTPRDCQKMLRGGYPNRLSTHQGEAGMVGKFLSAMFSPPYNDDEEWARAWEALFGHPIAWEYGSKKWRSSVVSGHARPGHMIDQAMSGQKFFKYRHSTNGRS